MSRLIAMLLTGFLALPPVSGSPVASMQDGVAADLIVDVLLDAVAKREDCDD